MSERPISFESLHASIAYVQAQLGMLADRIETLEAENVRLRERLTERDILIDELRRNLGRTQQAVGT